MGGWQWSARGQVAAKHPTMHRTAPSEKLVQNVDRAELGKPRVKPTLAIRNPGLLYCLASQGRSQDGRTRKEGSNSKRTGRQQKKSKDPNHYRGPFEGSLSLRPVSQTIRTHSLNKHLLSNCCGPPALWALDTLTARNPRNPQESCPAVWFGNTECGAWRTSATGERTSTHPTCLFLV